ncbi:MAG: hypothetical protein ACI841_003120 [Planctomycetota bacterium]|jgi:hypothetical protein
MTRVDQFESVFRSADKPLFPYQPHEYARVMLVTDLAPEPAAAYQGMLAEILPPSAGSGGWLNISGERTRDLPAILDEIRGFGPDLVCTYRNLHSEAWRWPYSLGEAVDVLTQATGFPVLVLPHPEAGREHEHAMQNLDQVMALSDHLAGSAALVNAALGFAESSGKLWLAHVEDDADFERIMTAISKIPAIDTDLARESLMAQLLKEPHDYITTCRNAIGAAGSKVSVEEIVVASHRLEECKRLVLEHKLDLVVMNTKDEDQLAMHGLAYPLAVELREVPLLLL